MTARISQATYIANVVAAAQARGVTDPDALSSLRRDAIDLWQYLNTFSGVPLGGAGGRQRTLRQRDC
jgi:hypothetical protein